MEKLTKAQLRALIDDKAQKYFGIKVENASENQLYKIICLVTNDILTTNRVSFKENRLKSQAKQVYYMSMEFLLGRSLKNHLFNLGIENNMKAIVKSLGKDMDNIYSVEKDAGLGNGGLGRLAAAYMESLTNLDYAATGFSIKYDFGIFRQKMVNGWQMELPDEWLDNGYVWLNPRVEETYEVKFGGDVVEYWKDGRMYVEQKNCYTVLAEPYDMNISGYDTKSVNKLRLWSSKAPVDFDMQLFSKGEYLKSVENKALAESISKVLYPADDHMEGKSLRLKQQYFFVSASIQSIVQHHIRDYGTLDNFPEKVAIHINDTHPTLCIPELMRILLDDHGMSWEQAWDIVTRTMSYTNHTVMAEALEKWPESLFKSLLPRIHQIVEEINRRFCQNLWNVYPEDWNKISDNAIVAHGQIRMANMCLAASHTINGVSALHSDILKNDVFKDYYKAEPMKFTNVTNGITYRRWLVQSNPDLAALIEKLIGKGYLHDAAELKKLENFIGDNKVLADILKVKRKNKERLAKYIKENNGVEVNPDSIFDVQVKRLHEYKRQLLNALHILDLYFRLKDNPELDINPRTFIFGAKAAPSYYMAKQIIRLICAIGNLVNNDPDIKGKIKVVFLENYRVSLAEIIMPAADVSEQISVAGKEASGTGNMKFMINGAITIGTMDGANVEIHENVGDNNIFIFGLKTEEVEQKYRDGYEPTYYYNNNPRLRRVIDALRSGIGGECFSEIADALTYGGRYGAADPYMVLADFESYCAAQDALDKAYSDKQRWARMSLVNTANAGFFSSDRSIAEYAERIWDLDKIVED